MNLEENATGQGGRTNGTWEVEVTQDMCNAFGTKHGPCAAFLFDHATLGTMVFQRFRWRRDDSDPQLASARRSVRFRQFPRHFVYSLTFCPPNGDLISIYAESVFVDKGGRVARCEIREEL
ncbi:hypothetical protein C8F01DRAFT_161682 [Mycena amicta]|nr:hypothetical protein C8F01DRAFT_161682 [Mycena amicta]